MKKYISYLLTLALLVPAFVSCTQERDFLSKKQKTHTVHFATSEPATRTGLTIEDNMVKPDWRKTDNENVHFFEIDANNDVAYGVQEDEISLSSDNRTAHFKAVISEEVVIHIDPSTGEEDNSKGAKSSSRVSPFTFAAVVAQKEVDAYTFVIPYEQHPDAETLKDPNAEFLVGYSRKSYTEQYDYESDFVDLYFDRVAALGRLAISGFIGTGEKVKSVTITANGGMTGEATYPGDFTLGDKNKVNFTKVNEPLVLAYGDGVAAPAEDPFYAYFVAVPGEATVTSIEVLTDQYKYTKTVAQGAKFTFSDEQLLNIDFALSEDIAESVTADNNTWYKASVLEAGYDYLIVSGGQALKNNNGETAAVAVDPQDGVITFERDVDPAIIWTSAAYTGTGLEEYGHFTFSNGAKYLYRYSETTTQIVSIGDLPDNVTKHYVWDYDGTYLYHVSSASDNRIYYCWYDGGWKTSNTGQMATALYTTRVPQTISFAGSGLFEYDLDDPTVDFEEPALGDHFGDVTYSSSDENIATVDSETGEVTFLKAGVVEITATAAGDDSHQAATASYMIVVTSSQIPTWYKADELVDGEVYMIVSNANALRLNGTALATVANSAFTGDSFQYEADDNLKWTATASSGKFTFKSGNSFLSRSSTNIQTNTSSGAAWSYDSDQNYITTAGSSSTYYLYFSESQGKWQVQTSGGDTHKAAVYTMTPALVSRNLNFSAETVTHDLADGEDVNEPELIGDKIDDITFAVTEGSDVASVDPETGVVTLSGITGSATITASALATDTYKAGSVSYTLIVKNSNIPTKRYVLANSIVAGKKYLIVSGGQALKNNSGNIASEAVVPDNGVIELESGQEANLVWTAASESGFTDNGHFSFSNGNYRFSSSHGSSPSLKLVAVGEALDKYAVWDRATYNGEDYLYHFSVGGGNDYHYFAYYNSGWKMTYVQTSSPTPSNTEKPTQLYVEDDGGVTPPTPEKQERNLSFGTDSFSCTLGQSATFPTLSGVTDGVTYSSSEESVATVNASGVVTVKAAGTTIIKAEALESDTYLYGSAQYTLTVEPAASQSSTYVLIPSSSGVISGATYLIVSADAGNYNGADHKKAFAGDEAGNAVDVSASNGTITGNYSDYEFTITKSGNNYILYGPNGYVTGNSSTSYSRYIQVSNSEVTMSLATASELSAASSNDGQVSDAFYFYYTKDTSKEVLYYNSDKMFKIGGTGRKYGVYLYMKYNGEEVEQNLSFNPTSVTIRQNQTFTKPTLSGAKTTVTYASDNTEVASVDLTTGDVNVEGVGMAHITATAVKSTVNGINYGSAHVSYTLIVNEAAAVQYYKKINSRDDLPSASQTSATGDYLFVYEDGVKAYVFKAICNGTPTGAGTQDSGHVELTKDGSAIEVDLTADGIAATDAVKDCKIQLAHHSTATRNDWNIKPDRLGSYWVRVNNSTNGVRILAMTSAGYSGTFTFNGTGNNLEIKRTDSNRDAYWSYNSTNNCFEATSTASKISIYKLSE